MTCGFPQSIYFKYLNALVRLVEQDLPQGSVVLGGVVAAKEP